MYFTTTRLHQELAGGTFVDVIIDEAHDPQNLHPFKGNVDLGKLEALIAARRRRQDPLRQPGRHGQHGRRPARQHGQRARRCAPSATATASASTWTPRAWPRTAFFIQEREEGYQDKPIAAILKEFCSYTDGAWMSSKKDHLVNIGGWLAMNHEDLFEKASQPGRGLRGAAHLRRHGRPRHGGGGHRHRGGAAGRPHALPHRPGALPGRAAHATGTSPSCSPSAATPSSSTPSASTPTCPRIRFPAQTLAAQLYLDSGIRVDGARRASAPAATRQTGDHRYPKLELVRLTIPRRVYTQAHMDVVAESVKAVYDDRHARQGPAKWSTNRAPALLPGTLRADRGVSRLGSAASRRDAEIAKKCGLPQRRKAAERRRCYGGFAIDCALKRRYCGFQYLCVSLRLCAFAPLRRL